MMLTVKCKLITDTRTKIDSVEDTLTDYANVANAYFKILTKKHLGWSKKKLMVLLEKKICVLGWFPAFPSALRQSARDKAIESYKSWVKAKGRKPRIKPSVRLDRRSYRIIKTDNSEYPYFVSITTKWGRVRFPLGIGGKRLKYFEYESKSAEIVKIDGQFYINIVFEVPEQKIEKTEEVLGVDIGLTNIATIVSEESRNAEFVSGLAYKKRLTQLREQYRTAKARKSKMRIGRKISRLNNGVAHKVSRKIVSKAVSDKAKTIIFEDLKKCKPEKGKKRKKVNFRLSMWMRRRIQAYTIYKAGLNGVPVVTVDPSHTSQRCPRCNHTERKNRKGILFSCRNCGYSNNADRVGSINIAQKYLGVFVGHKLPADNTHVNGWRRLTPSEEGIVSNFVSPETKPTYL